MEKTRGFSAHPFLLPFIREENVSAGYFVYVCGLAHNQLRLFMDNYFKERWKKQ